MSYSYYLKNANLFIALLFLASFGNKVKAVEFFTSPSPIVDERFGGSVSLSGDGQTLAVGVRGRDIGTISNAGVVYVLSKSNDGSWQTSSAIQLTSPATNDYFGRSVSLSSDGQTLAVGADGRDIGTISDAGTVYIISRNSDGSWPTSPGGTIQAASPASNDWFGNDISLSSDGQTLAVGALGTKGIVGSIGTFGAVYVVTKNSDGGWPVSPSNTIQAASGGIGRIGDSVSLSSDGQTLAVGASSANVGFSAAKAGVVYVLAYNSNGTWSLPSSSNKIQVSSPASNEFFGDSVSLSGDGQTLAVGAYGTNGYAGAVYVLDKNNDGSWPSTPSNKIQVSLPAANDFFGRSVSLSNDGQILTVGAKGRDIGANSTAGAVYILNKNSDGSWPALTGNAIQATLPAAEDLFGGSVSLSSDGQTLAVGAEGRDIGTTSNTGAVYLY